MDKEGIFAFSDSVLAKTAFGEIDITIRSVNKDDLQKLRDIIIDFYEGLATMCQNMGDECSTYGFYAEDRVKPTFCKHCNPQIGARSDTLCDLHGGKCEFYCNEWKNCAMYEAYPF